MQQIFSDCRNLFQTEKLRQNPTVCTKRLAALSTSFSLSVESQVHICGGVPSHCFFNTDKITPFGLCWLHFCSYFQCLMSKMLLLCFYMNDQKLAAFSRRHLLSCFPLSLLSFLQSPPLCAIAPADHFGGRCGGSCISGNALK